LSNPDVGGTAAVLAWKLFTLSNPDANDTAAVLAWKLLPLSNPDVGARHRCEQERYDIL